MPEEISLGWESRDVLKHADEGHWAILYHETHACLDRIVVLVQGGHEYGPNKSHPRALGKSHEHR